MPTFPQGTDSCLDNVFGGVEVGLADFKVNNPSPLCFERFRPRENLKSGFCASRSVRSGSLDALLMDVALFCSTKWVLRNQVVSPLERASLRFRVSPAQR
jgi:hypothetical protein